VIAVTNEAGRSDCRAIAAPRRLALAHLPAPLGLAPFALAASPSRAVAGPLEFGDDHRFIEFRYRAEDLPDQLRRGTVVKEGRRAVRGNQRHAQVPQHGETDFLNHKIASEAVRRLDDDRADTIAGDAGKQRSEAGSRLDRIGTAHCSVVERGP
jgi:hypothetical protein